MSRYAVCPLNPHQQGVVGWDNALETYYLQVHDLTLPPQEERCIVWVGTDTAEIPTLEVLQAVIAPYATIPPAIVEVLQQDYAERTPPTPLQRQLIALARLCRKRS